MPSQSSPDSRPAARSSTGPFLARSRTAAPSSPAYLPLSLLAPAALAAKTQEHGLAQLADALSAQSAFSLFAPGIFDYLSTVAITSGAVGMDMHLLDLHLGVLSFMQLGLHFWYRRHTHHPDQVPPLLDLARQISFTREGVLGPEAGLGPFRSLWGDALGKNRDFPHEEIMYHLVDGQHRDATARGSSEAAVVIAGIHTSWHAFAQRQAASWQAAGSGSEALPRVPVTRADLEFLVTTLVSYGVAVRVLRYVPGALRPPTSGGGGARVLLALLSSPLS